ncbi:S-layer homology domain-containing protein [Paenibacillus sp. ACRRX]|uniref:S-layer homology domain-containing protein n=1 Tax=Paenibacillus sp. ACRRX TaxID=2918206 RepID=UPI001EF6D47C|nr:S-layer homology domain-containing protein [Paenibacillus sp. ACRRX]MCG7406137.1 S-layer homology domain-containing protein [Paenibacillus sp. ACRRX]
MKRRWSLLLLTLAVALSSIPMGTSVQAQESKGSEGKATVELVSAGSHWSYNDEGIDYSQAMKQAVYDYSSWKLGLAPFGYKEKNGIATNEVAPDSIFDKVATTISFGGNAKNKHTTTYFSKVITIDEVRDYASFEATFGVDDGYMFYVNGAEISRGGMPDGEVTYGTLSTSSKDKPVIYKEDVSAKLKAALKKGNNTLTVEVHNQSLSSSDLYFDMMLTAVPALKPLPLVTQSSLWRYNDEGIDHSRTVTDVTYDYSSWKSGLAPFGYKEKNGAATDDVMPDTVFDKVSTMLDFGQDRKNKRTTSYLSKTITIADLRGYGSFESVFGADDGFIFYVNGIEVFRGGMPEGPVTYATLAASNKDKPVIYTPDLNEALKKWLRPGPNVLTIEVHNQSPSSSDLYFDMKLTALPEQDSNGGGTNPGGGNGGNPGNQGQGIVMLSKDSSWKYLDDGSNQGTAWRTTSYNDSGWASGRGPLGYPADESTTAFGSIQQVISYGKDAAKKHPTTYFRSTMDVNNLSAYNKIVGQFGIDDGVILYVNGTEVYRYNMPAGEPDYQTYSATTLGSPTTETADLTQALKSVLKEGRNVLAAEVHQRSGSSSDLYWAMQLIANPKDEGQGNSGNLIPTALSMTFNGDPSTTQGFAWYTDPKVQGTKLELAPTAIVTGPTLPAGHTLTFEGTSMDVQVYQTRSDKSAGKRTVYASHKVLAQGLQPNTTYSYRVGDGQDGHWSGISTFTTAKPSDEAYTFLYTTDPQGTTEPEYVTWNHTLEEGMKKFPSSRFITVTGDLVDHGDIEDQWMWMLNKPKSIFKEIPLVPTVGNHENKLNNNYWYHFNLPNISYTGAKPDGSVYSFDYGAAHFMVINTEYNEVKDVDVVYKKQEEWLRKEAAKSNQKWKIVMFHKSPYSVASHTDDSDTLFFRDKLTSLFDELGIDVVLSGHDHSYTRTYPMYNHEPQKNTPLDGNGSLLNPKGTLYLVSNAAGDKRYSPKKGPFPFAEKYGQPNKEMFTGVTVTEDKISFDVYTTTETGSTDRYDQFSIKKTTPKPNLVREAKLGAIQNGSAAVSWLAPSSGPEITNYRIYEKSDQLGPNWNVQIRPEQGKASYSYIVQGLDAAKSYQFVIKAVSGKVNADGVVAVLSDSGSGNNNGNGNGNGNNNGNGNGSSSGGNSGSGTGTSTGNAGGTSSEKDSSKTGSGSTENGKPSPSLSDVSGHWAENAIRESVNRGFITGYADGTFKPNKQVSRAELVAMLTRALQRSGDGAARTFADQDQIQQWAVQAIRQGVEAGWVTGYSNNTFQPNRALTRTELAVIIVRTAGLEPKSQAKLNFADVKQIPAWAVPYVAAAAEAGYIKGISGNRFAPNAHATRAEAVSMIVSLLARNNR